MRHHYQHIAEQLHTPIDFVKWTLPLHFGGVYAYLTQSLLCGAVVTVAFYLAYSIQENK